MTAYYLIRGDQVIVTINSDGGDVLALPLLCGGDAMSLLNAQHAQNLMDNLSLTAAEALAALGVSDLRGSAIKAVFLAPNPVGVDVSGIATYHLLDVNNYALWQCDGQPGDLLTLHDALYAMEPANTAGLLAIVQTFGDTFYSSAVRTQTGMTAQQALARRDRIATYLEGLGHTNTAALRAATDEDAQMIGIVTALNHTEQQLWNAMVN